MSRNEANSPKDRSTPATKDSTSPAPDSASAPAEQKYELADQAVLDYLKKKGLSMAALELTKHLDEKSDTKDKPQPTSKERLEEEDAQNRTQRTMLAKSTGGGYGYDRDSAWPIVQWAIPDTGRVPEGAKMGAAEARAYIDAFTSLQLWVLSLPDEDGFQTVESPLVRAQQLLKQNKEAPLQSVIQELTKKPEASADASQKQQLHLPPSAKPELLAITFALLVHTYCELLEFGMESTAHTLRDAFKPLYEPMYSTEYRDLYHCTTTEDMMRLNSHNSQHMEALTNLKSILVQIASYQLRREELNAQTTVNGAQLDARQQAAKDAKIKEYDNNIQVLQQKYKELSQRASLAFGKMYDLPFLRRARAVRWQLTLSTMSYGLLASFLNARDDSLLVMSTLLQTKCELHVECRDPLPFTPSCVLNEKASDEDEPVLDLHKMEIDWAAPMPRSEEESNIEKLPFPKFHLDKEYDDETKATQDKKKVEFNRALLVNGFRRLEALERKREFEVLPASSQKRAREGDQTPFTKLAANPLEPSILMTTLCANTSGPVLRPSGPSATMVRPEVSAIWEESGIGLCCAKMSPPDGRRVAVGCDDSAVRIWNIMEAKGGEPSHVLYGHKNGFPVFDVDWNRDGRSLLSAGGDGSVRLWDTMAIGPFGEVAAPKTASQASQASRSSAGTPGTAKLGNAPVTQTASTAKDPSMDVPGLRPENAPYTSGAALAVYRGHAPSSPVWSIAFAPSGYYFASAGGDATARLWTTDRSVPVRLFTGHTASNVNCVEWHPNCNYIITGSDDKTARLWDIQTGRTVRLLTGCAAGVNTVKVSPGGNYAAGADYSGIVHVWDLGSGKQVTEFRTRSDGKHQNQCMVHSLTFSACGTALASGGDDCCVRIWDVRSESILNKPLIEKPTKAFPTRRTLIMDLSFTKRNLLLSVGKFVTPIPLATAITD